MEPLAVGSGPKTAFTSQAKPGRTSSPSGAIYSEFAVRLGVSPDAVEFHVGNMRHKLGLRDRSELVAWRASGGEGRKALGALLPLSLLARRSSCQALPWREHSPAWFWRSCLL
ncbi:MAG: helix-turn-helix transcriptional regulator [Dehalococcoidia bacterium]|nr:helix-turn-helix transcriptional regulator [Dehalococcoidia bacterium]